jgi:hypothetical protein
MAVPQSSVRIADVQRDLAQALAKVSDQARAEARKLKNKKNETQKKRKN